jgi:HSP20 family protein
MNNTAIQKRENRSNVPERLEQSTFYTPLVDIIETDDEFVFQADLPGVKSGDVDITYENNVLTIQGNVQPRQPQDQRYFWQEYGVGPFYRQFTLNTAINADGIKAQFANGVLELHVPKAESARTRKVQIKAG